MNGARQLVRDTVYQELKPGQRVLDLCCGDCWLEQLCVKHGAHWNGIDAVVPARPPPGFVRGDLGAEINAAAACGTDFDLAISSWGIQHLLDLEAIAWAGVARVLKPNGVFLYIGRYLDAPAREMSRGDPLNGYNRDAFAGLAMATGFAIQRWRTCLYEGDGYRRRSEGESANAFVAVMHRIR